MHLKEIGITPHPCMCGLGSRKRRRVAPALTLDQLALMYADPDCNDSAKKLRIGHVILTGSDLDLHLFGSYLVDGVLAGLDRPSSP